MKRIFAVAGALMLLASCSVLKKSSTSVSLAPKVEALPTFYELQVSETSVTKDTAWTRSAFSKDRSSVDDVVSCLTASIVKSENADVLVEPKTTMTVKGSGRKSYKLSITGYPAKYVNFHTATPEEYDMLYGPRISPDQATLLLNPQNGVIPRPTKMKHVKVAKVKTLPYSRHEGFRMGLDLQTLFVPGAGFGVNVNMGSQLNQKWYLGGGLGLYGFTFETYDGYNHMQKLDSFLSLPLYAHARYYFLGKKISPYLDMQAGMQFLFDEELVDYTNLSLGVAFDRVELSVGITNSFVYEAYKPVVKLGFMF